jgi:hypothetical protein
MKYLRKFFEFLLEKQNIDQSVGKKICDFLVRSGYEYRPGYDSNVFISFKTGDFYTIIPPKALGGDMYSSPQGFYCFDMNGFKERLFGDDEILPENFKSSNLNKSSDAIQNLGLGYANNDNKVSDENIWENGIPRYLYFVRVKPGSNILSSVTDRTIVDSLIRFMRYYSFYFLSDNKSKVFNPKNKVDIGKKSLIEFKKYFKENSVKYKEDFAETLIKLIDSIQKDNRKSHILFYDLIKMCCTLIGGSYKRIYTRFRIMCESIGIDGFTQRKGESSFIHSLPEFQTVLLTETCVDELMKVDLVKEAPVKNKFTDKDLDELTIDLKKYDVVYFRDADIFKRISDIKKFREDMMNPHNKEVWQRIEKVDLDKYDNWNFIKELKKGDYLKITKDFLSDYKTEKGKISIIYKINSSSPDYFDNTNEIFFNIEARLIFEMYSRSKSILFYINGKEYNPSFSYDLNKQSQSQAIFDPKRIYPEYVYWLENREELEKKGATLETFLGEYKTMDIFDINQLFKSKDRKYYLETIKEDLQLLELLNNFQKRYANRVFSRVGSGTNKDFMKEDMTLLLYRGNLEKPYKIFYPHSKLEL